MNKEAKLILDNNAHKCSITVEGKQQKVTIAPFNEMSITEANEVIRQINEILNANYSFNQLIKLLDTAEKFPSFSRYLQKAINISIKLLHQNELQKYMELNEIKSNKEQLKKALVILNIGCTSVGKTLGNLYAIIPNKYAKNFMVLSSIKESTNFPIHNVVNSNEKNLKNNEEFEVEFYLKTELALKEDVVALVIEALQEILDAIRTEIKNIKNDSELWAVALAAGFERLKINKDKTFDISNSVKFINEDETLERILLQGIREHSTKSASYRDKLTDDQVKEGIIKDFRNNIFKLSLEEIAYILNENKEFQDLTSLIYNQLCKTINRFSEKYEIDVGFDQVVSVKKRFDDLEIKDLISNIFGDKKQRSNSNFFSIDSLISDAKLYFQNDGINNGEELIIVDGIGINQGQIAKGEEKNVAYNRVHAAIQQCNPDAIIYNTRLDTKDDYIIDVIKGIGGEGYKDRVYIVYGRVDTVLENYCDEEDLDISELSGDELSAFEKYIETEYLNKELISLCNIEKKKIFLCDKPCKLSKYPLRQFQSYTPKHILNNILGIYKEAERLERIKLNEAKINHIIDVMESCFVFNKTYDAFKMSIDSMVPMAYSQLRWNTLECGIRSLNYDGLGYASLYPSITLRNRFAVYLSSDEIKEAFGENYDDILKELLNQWTNFAHLLMVTAYKYEFSMLLRMRLSKELRTMGSLTLTDERKYILRNILNTCFENNRAHGPSVFRQLTKYVLQNILY